MTTTAVPTTSPTSSPTSHRQWWPLRRVGAACLVAAPVLFTAGLATAPVQTELTKEGFAQSLLDDPTRAVVSADLLHYSWLAWIVGLIAVLGLVQGRGRGHAFTQVAVVAAVLGCVQISGLLLGDLQIVALGADGWSAQQITDGLLGAGGLSTAVWLYSAQVLAMVGLLAVFAGLARAGHLRWYVAVLPVVGLVGGGLPLPAHLGLVVTLVGFAPAYVVARTLLRGPR